MLNINNNSKQYIVDQASHNVHLENTEMYLDIINNLSELGYVLSVPSGDDSAVWNSLDNSHVVTVDALVDKVHFNLDYISWEQLGSKSVSVNLSDIAAMGAKPIFITIVN